QFNIVMLDHGSAKNPGEAGLFKAVQRLMRVGTSMQQICVVCHGLIESNRRKTPKVKPDDLAKMTPKERREALVSMNNGTVRKLMDCARLRQDLQDLYLDSFVTKSPFPWSHANVKVLLKAQIQELEGQSDAVENALQALGAPKIGRASYRES